MLSSFGSFLQVYERKKKLNEFLQACTSGMAGAIFFKFGM